MKKKLLSLLTLTVMLGSVNYHTSAVQPGPLARFRSWMHGYSTIKSSAHKLAASNGCESVMEEHAEYAKKIFRKYYDMPSSKRDCKRHPLASDLAERIPEAQYSTMYRFMGSGFLTSGFWQLTYVKAPSKDVFVAFSRPRFHVSVLMDRLETRLTNAGKKHFKDFYKNIDIEKHGYKRFEKLHKMLLDIDNPTLVDVQFMNACELLKQTEAEIKAKSFTSFEDLQNMLLIVEDRTEGLSKFYVELMPRKYRVLPK